VYFFFFESKAALSADGRVHYQPILGILQTLLQVMKIILDIFDRDIQASSNFSQGHGVFQ
jgi:hypothetical protein